MVQQSQDATEMTPLGSLAAHPMVPGTAPCTPLVLQSTGGHRAIQERPF